MGEKVIEPSEIITGRDDTVHVRPSRANPWLRLIARSFDYSLLFLALTIFVHPFKNYPFAHLIPIQFFAWIPIETLLLMTLGTTPGKWLLKTEIRKGHAKRLDFSSALRRSFMVWFRGMGMGIPFINVLCMLNAFYRLKVFETTSWDRDENITVFHHPIAVWRLYFVSGVIAGIVIYCSFFIASR